MNEARLDIGDRATDSGPVCRYQRDRRGELVHVDIKELAGIPTGGGWKMHRRGQAVSRKRSSVGYHRAHGWFAAHGVQIDRALTDNGACYKSRAWRHALDTTAVAHKRTRPYRPQTNGKIERFHRILLGEWAYLRDWTITDQVADRVVVAAADPADQARDRVVDSDHPHPGDRLGDRDPERDER